MILDEWRDFTVCDGAALGQQRPGDAAILLASATATTLNGLRARSCVSQGYFPAAGAHTAIPRRLRPPECVANSDPPVWRSAPASACRRSKSSRGTIPIQAAKSRPDRKTFGSGTVAAIAAAPVIPIPGIVSSRWLASFDRCCTMIRFSIDPIIVCIATSSAARTTRLV